MTQEKDMNARNEALNDIESLPKIKGWVARDRFVQWTSRGPVFDGIGATINPFIGIYLGEKNYKGVENTYHLAKITAIFEGLIISVMIFNKRSTPCAA